MDIKQQTKNVAAQGRFGDSMLLHVNPAEVKGLASAMPITINPDTGQPEAFLPFLAPILGSMLAPSVLGAIGVTGLSAGAMAGIGAGLATYAQTGGSGSKALLSGLTAGLGTKALSGGAEAAVGADAATQAATDAALQSGATDITIKSAGQTASDAAIKAAQEGSKLGFNPSGNFRGFTPGESFQTMFSNRGLDAGMQSLAGAAMTPTGVLAATTAGTGAVMQSQDEFEAMLRQMNVDEEERKRLMYERYPEQIPVATGGSTNFADGGTTGYQGGRNVYSSFDPIMNMNYGGFNAGATRAPRARVTNPIPRGFMPGFMPEFSYFQNLNPSATEIQGNNQGGFRQPRLQPLSPPGGFRNENRFMPRFGGYNNPFMQTPSYRSFYGNPQMGGMINPYARFTQQTMQPYFAPPPVYTPPPRDDLPPPRDDVPPSDGPIVPPIDDGIGRKGRTRNIEPIIPSDDFVTRGPVRGPINEPMNTPPPTITIPIEGGSDVTIPDFSRINTPITPPMITGLENKDAMRGEMSIDRINEEQRIPPMINENPVTLSKKLSSTPPVTPPITPPTLPTPAAPTEATEFLANTPVQRPPMQPPMSIGGPGGGRNDMFRTAMFAEGKDTDKELPNEGLKALAKTEKGREAVEAMGYQEGQDINISMPTGQSTDMMMQDPIVQEVIQFILGETDNNEIINEFIIKYGQEQLMMLRDVVLKQAAGNPDAQTEGLIQGVGNSGMADDLPMNIGNKAIAAVSQDEYIIPADVVSMLGDGSSDAGSKQLDGMLDRVRMAKTGGKTQAAPLNPEEVLPA